MRNLLDTYKTYIVHRENYGNEENYLFVDVYILENNELLIEKNNKFNKFGPYNSGPGYFFLRLEATQANEVNYEFFLKPNEDWSDFEIIANVDYKNFQNKILHDKLSLFVENKVAISKSKNKL